MLMRELSPSTPLAPITAPKIGRGVRLTGVSLLVIVGLVLAGCEKNVEYSSFAMFQSLDHDKVVVVELAPPELAYSPTQVRVSISEGKTGAITEILTTKVSDDGGTITHENLKGQWLNADTLLLCFSGAEQTEAAFEVNVVVASSGSVDRACDDD